MKGAQTTFLFLTLLTLGITGQATRVGFYSRTCPSAEGIVRSTVEAHYRINPAVAPGLLRMHFHDCFVRGCDGSILIDGPNAEKKAIPNLSLRGYEVLDDAKTQLEAACPGVVSCADILALAARDSVALTNGPSWAVPTGRRDGRDSFASEVANLPAPTDPVHVQKQKFADLGLSTLDLVALVGGHTIGTAACRFFHHSPDISTATDPSACLNGTERIALDTGSPNRFDTSYFANVRSGRGILESDQSLWGDASTRALVRGFLGGGGPTPMEFSAEFSKSMVKMSTIGVKSGTIGEIRKRCSAVNA